MKKLRKAQKIGTFDPTKVDMWNPPQSYYPTSDRQNAPARQLSAEEIAKQKAAAAEALRLKKLYEQQELARRKQDEQQELARRKQAIASSIEAKDKELTAENFATETGAIGEKLRFFPNDPNSFIDEYINPFKMVGDMASGLGQIPFNIKQGDYGKAALNLAVPVTTGLLGGIGARSTGQFINNIVNPAAGLIDPTAKWTRELVEGSIAAGKPKLPEFVKTLRAEPKGFDPSKVEPHPSLNETQKGYTGTWIQAASSKNPTAFDEMVAYLTGPEKKADGPMQLLAGELPWSKTKKLVGASLPYDAKIMSFGPGVYGTLENAFKNRAISAREYALLKNYNTQNSRIKASPNLKAAMDQTISRLRPIPHLYNPNEMVNPSLAVKLRNSPIAVGDSDMLIQKVEDLQNEARQGIFKKPIDRALRNNISSFVVDAESALLEKYGGTIKRKNGSYSRRGLWDNIRDNAGSGKKPTAEMLKQERKIRNEKKEMGGSLPTYKDGNSVKGKKKGNFFLDWFYNIDDVQKTYGMANKVDSFYPNWITHPETQKRLRQNLQITNSRINPIKLTAESKANLENTPMFSRELVERYNISPEDIEYNNNVQGWKTPIVSVEEHMQNPYYFDIESEELGHYNPRTKQIIVNTFEDKGILAHEQVHATESWQKELENVISKKYPKRKIPQDHEAAHYLEYLDRDGMYPRVMDIRRVLNLKPGQKVDKSIFKKESIWSPVEDLKYFYDEDQILDMLNTLAYNKSTDSSLQAEYGGFFPTSTTGVPYQDKEYMYQTGGETDYNIDRANELGYKRDETGHLKSVDDTNGMWLKSKKHPTAWMELLSTTLNPKLQNIQAVVNPDGYFGNEQLQYIIKKQDGGNIYDKETDNLLAQISSMIADGEDPDMVAGSLVDNGYSEDVVDSLVEEAIDRLSELGDYEEEDINQIEDIKVLREGGIPDRYKNQGFTKVGAKRKSNRPGKKWMVLAKKGNKYKIVHGGYKGMKDYTQHGSEERRERFWDRMGGKNSAKAKDPFSPLYWHKRFGTWQDGGKTPIEDPEGQRKYPGKTTRIPSNRITMEGINYPVLAIGDNGKANLMLPGEEYLYLGVNYVDEVPFSK